MNAPTVLVLLVLGYIGFWAVVLWLVFRSTARSTDDDLAEAEEFIAQMRATGQDWPF